jgi:hypothetical protein
MKYIINNNQLFKSIFKFIDSEFTDDNLDYDYDINYDTEETEKNILNFFGNKYQYGAQDEWYFQYIKKEYYLSLDDSENTRLIKEWEPKAPILEMLDSEFPNKMNSFFGDYWKPVFEEWFKEKYPTLPVKTFLYR